MTPPSTTLQPRQSDVLVTIVEDYIATAAPVGSRTVARKSGLRLSAASMRNTMADLTEMGYLAQPHTSAGRIPTTEAFRFYLNTTLRPARLPDDSKRSIDDHLSHAGLELTDILAQASRLLSHFSHQVSLVVAPSKEEARWREIDFALVKPGLVLAVLILDGGVVQNKLVGAPGDLTADDLRAFANYLNAHYAGLTLVQARTRILAECREAGERLQDLYRRALLLAQDTFEPDAGREVFVDGASNLLAHSEFGSVERMRELLRLLEERSRLLDLVDRAIAERGVKVVLGDEADIEDLKECSIISSPYGSSGTAQGAVGVIGPLRMNYAALVPLVDHIARTLTERIRTRY
jgi:heat-inducible transcriptional repressor